MALKDIFTMIKADRYTADGCEEIKKAQEAIAEDAGLPDGTMRHRKDGDYIKQAGKWVPAKSANGGAKKKGPNMNAEAEKHAEARKDRESANSKQKLNENYKQEVKEFVSSATPERVQRYIKALRTPFSIERDNFEEPDKLAEALEIELKKKTESKPAEAKTYKNEEGRRDFRAAFTENPKDSYDFAKTVEKSIPMSKGDKEELKNLKSFMQDEGADYKQALRSRASNLVDGNKSNGDWYPEKEKSIMKIAKAVGYDKELHQFIEEEFKGYDLGYSEDAAPRQLTGDCKIRIRK